MTAWGVTVGTAVLVLGLSACGGGSEADSTTSTHARAETTTTTSTAPERPTSTTTTLYDPAVVEGQVEAAYLASWEVYADAVYHLELDEEALFRVYADEHLETKRNEIARRIAEGRASWVRIEHSYTVQLVDSTTAAVVDRYRNHQVLIDPVTKEPVEPDPDEEVIDVVTLKLVDGTWRVTRKERLE